VVFRDASVEIHMCDEKLEIPFESFCPSSIGRSLCVIIVPMDRRIKKNANSAQLKDMSMVIAEQKLSLE